MYRLKVESGAMWVRRGANGGPPLDQMFVSLDEDWIVVRAADDAHRTSLITAIEAHVDRANAILKHWNTHSLDLHIQNEIELQRTRRRRDEERSAQILADGFAPAPIKPETSIAPAPVPLPDQKYTAPERAESAGATAEIYELTSDQFDRILDCVATHRNSVERSRGAGAAADAGEDAHRDALLAALNGRFIDGTAESFSAHGKTDIRLMVAEHSYFYAEAKMWSGPGCVDDAVEQLTEKYLIYRDRFAALVFFIVNRADPTKVSPKIVKHLVAEHSARDVDPVRGFPIVDLPVPDGGGRTVRLAIVTIVVDASVLKR